MRAQEGHIHERLKNRGKQLCCYEKMTTFSLIREKWFRQKHPSIEETCNNTP